MYVGEVEEMMCVVCVSDTGGGSHSDDGYVLAATLCKYNLGKGDLFVLSWARMRRVRRGSLSSKMLMCSGGVSQYFVIASCCSMHRDNRCMYMTHVCLYVCCSDYVGVCENVCCAAAIVKYIGFFSLEVYCMFV